MKIPIIIKNSKVPNLPIFVINAYAIAFWPFIFVKDEGNEITFNHEKIHIRQQEELFIIPFYIIYFAEWIYNLVKYRDRTKAYYNISFEKEAYFNQNNLVYLLHRPKMAWRYYRRIYYGGIHEHEIV